MKKLFNAWTATFLCAICLRLGISFGQKKESPPTDPEPNTVSQPSRGRSMMSEEARKQQRSLIASTFYNSDGSDRVLSASTSREITESVLGQFAAEQATIVPTLRRGSGPMKPTPILTPTVKPSKIQASKLPVPFGDKIPDGFVPPGDRIKAEYSSVLPSKLANHQTPEQRQELKIEVIKTMKENGVELQPNQAAALKAHEEKI